MPIDQPDTEAETEKVPHELQDLICFALHSVTSAMNRAYKPHLSELGLTYPQYIALTALWHEDEINVGDLCKRLMTETNTLTPLLQRLESQGHIKRVRDKTDERQVIIKLTTKGRELQSTQAKITSCIISDTGIDHNDLDNVVKLVSRMRDNLNKKRQ